MKLNKALFCLAIICITTTLADYRHFPDRSNMFSEGRHSRSSPFLRRLDGTDNNSHDGLSAYNKTDPVTVRLQGTTELGYYYVTLFFGTPVQKQTLIVDTGSVTTTIPCTECRNECGKNHFDSPFNHNNSESFEEFKCDESFGAYSCYDCANQCPFSVSYVEGSSYSGHFNKDFLVFGNEIEDNFSILNQIVTNESSTQNNIIKEIRESVEELIEQRKVFMPFGCTNRETKLFYEQEADGILGLGVNTNTYSNPPNLLDALHIQDPKFSRAFSLCLAQDGGYFTMGGYNAAYHVPEENTHYTSYSDTFGQYKVYLHKIEMDGEDVGLKPIELNHGEGAFFDSGTTLTHVPSATYNGIRNKLHNHCQAGGLNCGNNSESSSFCWKYNQTVFPTLNSFYKTFPTFKFIFGKEKHAEYEWKAEDYLYLKDEEENVHCLGLAHYERETILGGTFMKNHDILFDKDKKRIGFVRANCNGVQELTKPLYVEKQEKPVETIKAGENSSPSAEVILTTETVSSHKMETVIIASVVSALVFAVVGGIGLLYVRAKRRRTAYQTMNNRRSIRIEIPSAGLSEQNLDMSGAETPQSSKEQAPQDEKDAARDEPSVEDEEDRSPKIRIDGDA